MIVYQRQNLNTMVRQTSNETKVAKSKQINVEKDKNLLTVLKKQLELVALSFEEDKQRLNKVMNESNEKYKNYLFRKQVLAIEKNHTNICISSIEKNIYNMRIELNELEKKKEELLQNKNKIIDEYRECSKYIDEEHNEILSKNKQELQCVKFNYTKKKNSIIGKMNRRKIKIIDTRDLLFNNYHEKIEEEPAQEEQEPDFLQ